MSVNNMTFEQAAAVMTAIYEQVTGKAVIGGINTGNFTSVAQAALKTGYDPLNTAISQVLSRTVFSIRPYNAKLKGLFTSPEKYGNHVRKINYVDGALEDDDRFQLVDGQSIDHYEVNKPEILQTNFYGAYQYQRHTTVYRDQLDNAFTGYEQFNQFVTGQMQNIYDQLEQVREGQARIAINNMILGKYTGDTANVLHLITLYNGVAGTNLDSQSVYNPQNFTPFSKWMYGFIQTLAGLMSERSSKFHINVTNKEIMRHTPADRLKAYINTQIINNIDASVLSGVFHDEKLKMVDYEPINFWQGINAPYTVIGKPTYLKNDGTLDTAANDVTADNVLGILFDEEAIGCTLVNQWSATTPLNARGGYTNTYWHETVRSWNDFSENCVILCMD